MPDMLEKVARAIDPKVFELSDVSDLCGQHKARLLAQAALDAIGESHKETETALADNAALRMELGHLARICRDIVNRDEDDPMRDFGSHEDQRHLVDAEKLLATDHPGQPLLDRLERMERALRIVAGLEQPADNLMGNADVARTALKAEG